MNIFSQIIRSITAAGDFAIYQKEILVLESFFRGIRTIGKGEISTHFSSGTLDLEVSRIGSDGQLVNEKNLSGFEFMDRPDKRDNQYLFLVCLYYANAGQKKPALRVGVFFNLQSQEYTFRVLNIYLNKVLLAEGNFAVHGSSRTVFSIFQKELERIASEIKEKKVVA